MINLDFSTLIDRPVAEGVMTGQVKSLMEGNFAKLKSVLESGA